MKESTVSLDLAGYDLDAPLEKAAPLPPHFYTDPEIARVERSELFARTWQVVGRAEQVKSAGQYFTTSLVDEPLLVARGSDGVLRGFYNVCRHRAGPPASGTGCAKAFQCAYHGWTYDLNGELRGTPEFAGVEDFNRANYGLKPVQVQEWGPLIFANLDPLAAPLSTYTHGLPEIVEPFRWTEMKYVRRRDYEIDCNWKVYVENYLEGYHIPYIHPGLFKVLDYSQYRTETRAWYSLQHSPTRQAGEEWASFSRYTGEHASYVWLFPNLMLNLYRSVFSVNIILPLGVNKTVTHFDFYFLESDGDEAARLIEESIDVSHQIQLEDVSICEQVQRGLSSSSYSPGRFSVARENGVHHFQTLLANWLIRGKRK
jgi:choline monooxygenase